MKRKIMNIHSTISPDKTIMEIKKILIQFGASKILEEIKESQIVGIAFIIKHEDKNIPIKLPMKIDRARLLIENAVHRRVLPKKFLREPFRTEKAMMVGWRIIKDWIHVELSRYEMDYADLMEIFLPYIFDVKTEKTYIERLQATGFKSLQLTYEETKK